ncbi:MAG: hypothetical protein K0S09_235 [Sphingobacteriaceae bacterium]|jgi:uncharacterized protein (DUF1015 family)|nr:hypothetical protein [Sphingobacteriaceae bacterium]
MPTIKSFVGIHPAAEFAAEVVLPLETLTIRDAKVIVKENPVSYANMLVPDVENPYLRGSKKELAYKKINENFDEFLERGVLVKDDKPAIYVYRIERAGVSQTGLWTLTSIDDYLNNTVKKHELTRAEREKNLIEYLQQTGIDANPVLIAYRPNNSVEELIADVVNAKPLLDFMAANARHLLWKIDDNSKVEKLTTLFADMKATYIADGHHRAAAACTAGIERRKLNLKHRGTEEYNFFSSVYMATDQLRILEFNRLVKSVGELGVESLLQRLSPDFDFEEQPIDCKPQQIHEFGMYFKGKWQLLKARSQTYQSLHPVDTLDVSILQDRIFEPVFGISNPRTDDRMSFVGGNVPPEDLAVKVDKGEFDVAFTLFPTAIDQLFAVADAGEVMPPKSTWFEPKFLAGLLIHQID